MLIQILRLRMTLKDGWHRSMLIKRLRLRLALKNGRYRLMLIPGLRLWLLLTLKDGRHRLMLMKRMRLRLMFNDVLGCGAEGPAWYRHFCGTVPLHMACLAAEEAFGNAIIRQMAFFLADLACTAVRSLARTVFAVHTDSPAGAARWLHVGIVRHSGVQFR